jgi:hypothetical protein
MNGRWLISLGSLLLATVTAPAQSPVATVGHLVARELSADAKHLQAIPFTPQPGDIVLYDDFNRFFHFLFKIANTAPPTHTALVIAGNDGKPALLELTGPKVLTARVVIMDVDTRFRSYPGIIMVRKIREPLTADQSRELTQFAEAQQGKAFAWPRVILQGTPLCPRTGLRKELFGHTYLDRNRWFCSELVVAACVSAKILDGKKCCANATYPHDLAVDRWLDLSASYHPPARWTADGSVIPASGLSNDIHRLTSTGKR